MTVMTVRYKGLSTYRILQASQLESDHGIVLQDQADLPAGIVRRIKDDLAGTDVNPKRDLIWGPFNRYSLVLDVDDGLEMVLREQGHFTLSVKDDVGADQVVATAVTNEDNPAVVQTSDGQSTEVAPAVVEANAATVAAADAEPKPRRR